MAHNGESITPTAAKPRTVLAMLAMNAGKVVPLELLSEELWHRNPPKSAKTTIQTYVMQVRKLAECAIRRCPEGAGQAKDILVTLPGGYLLNAETHDVDMWEFERLAEEGHRALEAGNLQLAAAKFAGALDKWRGPVLMDVQLGRHLKVHVQRLQEGLLSVLQCRIDADLRLGRHHELIGELMQLVQECPTHEGFYKSLIIALHRSGRRREALSAYRELHTALTRELGLEPSLTLQRLHQSILLADRETEELVDTAYWLNTAMASK
ncbi:BTAD domain-containing putative transcriptional regulator [Nonomuraea sp. NPDC049400]|uniref:AfsR/SARP family transcriptional regulator n=1 Tax=Nonomuraea sp. NPDC049400 TaxID=3364352 RepID=UPI0037B14646